MSDVNASPMYMLSKSQVKQLKAKGLWREPVIRPENWIEDMLDQALKEAVNPGLPTTQTLEKEDSLLHDN